MGTGRYTITGDFIPMQLKVGDLVVLPTQGFTKLPFNGEEYYVGPENQVLAKIKLLVWQELLIAADSEHSLQWKRVSLFKMFNVWY